MPTVNAGSIASIHCPLDSTITVTPGATAKVSVQSVSSPSFLAATITDAKTLPVTAGDLVIITAIGADVTYTDPALSAAQVAATVNALTAHPGDWMRGVAGKQTSDIAAAISTTAVAVVAIPVASTKVRVAWIGRGSAGALAGTERLYLACNRPNDVAGLVRSQDPRSRQFTLAPDEAVMITSSVPITSIHFSASASISANFHAIRVNHEVSA